MRRGIVVAILLSVFAIVMPGQPNKAPAQKQSSPNPECPLGPAPEHQNISNYYGDESDNHSPEWYAAIKRPEWWALVIAVLTGVVIVRQAIEMTRATDEMRKA